MGAPNFMKMLVTEVKEYQNKELAYVKQIYN